MGDHDEHSFAIVRLGETLTADSEGDLYYRTTGRRSAVIDARDERLKKETIMNDQVACNIPAPAPTRGFQLELYRAMESEWDQYRTAREIVPLVIVNSIVPILGNNPKAITAEKFLQKVRATLLSGKSAGYFVDITKDDQRSFRIANKDEYNKRLRVLARAKVDRDEKDYLRNQRPVWKKIWGWIRS